MTRRKAAVVVAFILLVALATVSVATWLGAGGNGGVQTQLAVWAVAVNGTGTITAVGGTADSEGDLVVAQSSSSQAAWSIRTAAIPALTSVAYSGPDRLVGSRPCLPPSAGGTPIGPGPASCLFVSDDDGGSWRDLGAGRLVDPTFASVDPSYGWAHEQFPSGGPLYATTDGGNSWTAQTNPFPTETPLVYRAQALANGGGYALCFAVANDIGQDWTLVRAGTPGTTVLYRGRASPATSLQGLLDDYVQGFSMTASGDGLIWGSDGLYRTADGGSSWSTVPTTVLDGGSFWGGGTLIDGDTAYLIRRGSSTEVVEFHSGTFSTLGRWSLHIGTDEVPTVAR